MSLSHRRLISQQLTRPVHTSPAEVVRWLGAVQAQDYLFAKWSLAQRLTESTDRSIEESFDRGDFLRTHLMRPTWFFVPPGDIRWMLELTAPRVHQINGTYYRKEGVDAETAHKSQRLIVDALERESVLTRDQLYALLREHELVGDSPALRGVYILMHAELEGLICSGPMQGKQQSYMLLAERAPNAHSLPRDEALAELARRYFLSHGPATRRDFSRWSGLTLADSATALDMIGGELESETIEKESWWFAPTSSLPAAAPASDLQAFLVSGYDEYLNGYASWSHATQRSTAAGVSGESYLRRNQMAIVDGEIVGVWGRTLTKSKVCIEIDAFFDLTDTEISALHEVANALGRYYERKSEITIAPFAS